MGLSTTLNKLALCVQCPTLSICPFLNSYGYSETKHCFGKEASIRTKIAAETAVGFTGEAVYPSGTTRQGPTGEENWNKGIGGLFMSDKRV